MCDFQQCDVGKWLLLSNSSVDVKLETQKETKKDAHDGGLFSCCKMS
jgi:hypothetical protein